MVDREKVAYFASSLASTLARRGFSCPSCGGGRSVALSRKYLVTSLRRCEDCALQFRAPTTAPEEQARYYGTRYESGFTTEMPGAALLSSYLDANFAGTPKDFARYVSILSALGLRRGQRLLDLGCSWGYGLWQFRAAGYEVAGLEVGAERARFARERLGMPVASQLDDLEGDFDVVFSSHVLEHIASLAPLLSSARSRLRENGLFIAVTPNGSAPFRSRSPQKWDRLWGFKHPLFLDAEFWKGTFGNSPFFLTTELDQLDGMSAWSSSNSQTIGPLDGWELLAASRKWAEQPRK